MGGSGQAEASGGRSGGSFELSAAGEARLVARGPLTFATARAAREQGLRALAAATAHTLEVDCSGVTHSDSAGLAVLLDWLGAVSRTGRVLRYTRLPADLVALGSISEVEQLLEKGA